MKVTIDLKKIGLAALIILVIAGAYFVGKRSTPNDASEEIQETQEEVSPEETKYNQAEQLFAEGEYEKAASLYQQLGAYMDSQDKYKESVLRQGESEYKSGEYELALKDLEPLGDYSTAKSLISKCYMELGNKISSGGDYNSAIAYYEKSSEVKAKEQIDYCNYQIALQIYEKGKYKQAAKLFDSLGKYSDAEEYHEMCLKKIQEASEYFEVSYVMNRSDEEADGKFYKNGEGKLVFTSDIPLDAWVDFDGGYVTYTIPMSSIHLRIKNKGKKNLVNPVVRLDFEDVFLKDVYGDFYGENHINGLGGYATAVLQTYEDLQPGTSQDYILEMQEAYFVNGKSGKVKITVSADNYKARTYTVSLKLN